MREDSDNVFCACVAVRAISAPLELIINMIFFPAARHRQEQPRTPVYYLGQKGLQIENVVEAEMVRNIGTVNIS